MYSWNRLSPTEGLFSNLEIDCCFTPNFLASTGCFTFLMVRKNCRCSPVNFMVCGFRNGSYGLIPYRKYY